MSQTVYWDELEDEPTIGFFACEDGSMWVADWEEIGPVVKCKGCGRRKLPMGRDSSLADGCTARDCQAYHCDPKPSDLWPGESRKDFGYSPRFKRVVTKP